MLGARQIDVEEWHKETDRIWKKVQAHDDTLYGERPDEGLVSTVQVILDAVQRHETLFDGDPLLGVKEGVLKRLDNIDVQKWIIAFLVLVSIILQVLTVFLLAVVVLRG